MTGSKTSTTGGNTAASGGNKKKRSPSSKKAKNENKENKKNSKSKSKNKNNESVLNEVEIDKSTGGEISTVTHESGMKASGLESPSTASFVSEAITVSMNSFSEDTRTSKSAAMVSVITDVNNNDSDALNRNSNSSTPISTIGSFTATSAACDLVSVPNSDLAICVKDENNNLVVGIGESAAESNKKKSKTKPNKKFHQLFPSISLEEQVIETYSCAYVKSLNLYQGMMFVTNNYICFHSKILNHENILILKFTHINTIAKSMHALIFPTAIRIQTQNSTYSFTSFRSRSQTLTLLNRLLNASRGIQSSSFSTGSPNITSDATSDMNLGSALNTSPEQKCDLIDEELRSKYRDGEKKMREMALEDSRADGDTTTNKSYTSIVGDEDDRENSLSGGSYCADSNLIKKPVLSTGGQIKAQFLVRNHPDNRSFTYYNDHSTTTNPNLIYDFDYSNLSENMVRISLRHKKTLLQKVKLIMGILIPGFFDISRIDALLPICFTMCVLLLLNAFVLLNKVNKVDDLFSDLLDSTDFPFHFDANAN